MVYQQCPCCVPDLQTGPSPPLLSHVMSQVKCAQYWPSADRETEIFEEFIVKLSSEDHCPDYIVRHLSVTNVSLTQ